MTALVTDYRRLLLLVCHQFTEATGWRLRFTPASEETVESVLNRLESDACCCWHTEVRDESSVFGFLHLEVPEFGEPPTSLASVTTFAQTLAKIVTEFVSAAHELDTSARDLSTLVDLKCSLRQDSDLPSTLSELLTAAVQLTESRGAAFFLLDPSTQFLSLRAAYQLGTEHIPLHMRELKSGDPDLQALTGTPVVLERDKSGNDHLLPKGIQSALCVSVAAESVPLGTIWVYDRRVREYSDRQIHVLQSIAIQTASVLERMVLLRESETQHRLSRELRMVSETQQDASLVEPLEDPRFEVAFQCVSAHELGGDLCETLPLSENQTGITVGDASGNSIPAAMVQATVHGAMRTLQAEEHDVVGIMERVNAALHSLTHSQNFMSMFYGILDAEEHTLTYCNAGHCNPIFIRGEEVKTLESHGLLLGVLGDTTYDFSVVDLQAGDLLVFYSDGISEAMNHTKELFRSKGIVAAILESLPGSAADLLEGIWSRAEAHCDGSCLPDDRTLMVIKILQ